MYYILLCVLQVDGHVYCFWNCRKHHQPDFSVVWLWETPASGWGSIWESSSFAPWFVCNVFWNVAGVVPEWPGISGFRRKSSRRDSAPIMRLFVLLNSWDNFFVTPPSVSSETWVMYFSCDLGTFEFRAKLLLGWFSHFSLLGSASFRLFHKVAIFYGKK